jgi:hypothetical protein
MSLTRICGPSSSVATSSAASTTQVGEAAVGICAAALSPVQTGWTGRRPLGQIGFSSACPLRGVSLAVACDGCHITYHATLIPTNQAAVSATSEISASRTAFALDQAVVLLNKGLRQCQPQPDRLPCPTPAGRKFGP